MTEYTSPSLNKYKSQLVHILRERSNRGLFHKFFTGGYSDDEKIRKLKIDILKEKRAIVSRNHLAESRGGTNHLDNLQPLCRKCHAKEHKNIDFNNPLVFNRNSESAVSKRTKSITSAIQNGRSITFGYKKGGENKFTQRSIRPTSIVGENRRDGSTSVCVVGHCFTRNAVRQFALNKMDRLTVLNT